MSTDQAKFRFNKFTRGFTLIEMVVAVGIFAVVMFLGLTAVFSAINANRESQSSNLTMTNLSIAIEAMSRSIRTGTNYSGGGNSITFTPGSGIGTVTYSLANSKIQRTTSVDGYTGDVTAPEVIIDDLRFNIFNTPGQPSVLVLIKGHAVVNTPDIHYFYLQSLISQRLITSI